MKIRKNDNVLVISGKDRGKSGKVRNAIPGEDRLLVEGINMIKKHARPRGQARQAGIIERENPIRAENVMLLCPKCSKPSRVGSKHLDNGQMVRICKVCNEVID